MTDPEQPVTQSQRRFAIVTNDREVRACAELWHASNCVLDAGLTEERGASWQFLASLVLTAFAFEAYMNHVGQVTLASWGDVERKLSPLSKFALLCEVLKIRPPAAGERPMQTLTELFRFRNALAHGRTHPVSARITRVPTEEVDEYFQRERMLTDWEKLIEDDAFACRAREDVETIAKLLQAAGPEPRRHPFAFGGRSGSATLEPV